MSLRSRFRNLSIRKPHPAKIQELHSGLSEESNLDVYYLSLTIGSCAIATLGLLSNSAAVIIGAMIIAPLMLPIRSLAFAALAGNIMLFRKSFRAIAVGTLVSIALAWLLGFTVAIPEFGSEVTSRSQPTLIDLGIAIAAGAIAGFAKVEPKISSSLAGTAIAVALMPPVCVVGLGLSKADWILSGGAALLYVTNLLGITLSCMAIFIATGCSSLSRGAKALRRTAILTSILIIPLGVGFTHLWRQKELEVFVQKVLVNETTTFKKLRLINTDIDWGHNPPEAYLTVDAIGDITIAPNQVRLLEDFVAKKTGKRFTLILQISQVEEIRRESIK